VERSKIIFLLLAFLTIFTGICTSGCLQQSGSGQSSHQTNATPIANNSLVVSPTTTTTIHESISSIPTEQSGIRTFKDSNSICIGQTLTYGLINEGNSTIVFGCGDPYWIQVYDNGTWENIFNGGGFQAYCNLYPGNEIKRGWNFSTGTSLYEWHNKSGPLQEFTVRPGSYRIMFLGRDANTNENFTVATEFTIHQC
jgi:hypothetical protein